MSRRSRRLAITTAAALLAACSAGTTAPYALAGDASSATHVAAPAADVAGTDPRALRAVIRDRAGAEVGVARLHADATGRVHLTVHAAGLAPGLHGMHLHAAGTCDASAGFGSAGGHLNPAGRKHGHRNPEGHHAGDLPNLVVNEGGIGRLSAAVEQFRLTDLLDADGTALVLHEREDDLATDGGPLGPGSSGARIACGVLQQD